MHEQTFTSMAAFCILYSIPLSTINLNRLASLSLNEGLITPLRDNWAAKLLMHDAVNTCTSAEITAAFLR